MAVRHAQSWFRGFGLELAELAVYTRAQAQDPALAGELARKHGVSEGTIYAWKAKFGGMSVSDAQRLRTLEEENGRLKRLLFAERSLGLALPVPSPLASFSWVCSKPSRFLPRPSSRW